MVNPFCCRLKLKYCAWQGFYYCYLFEEFSTSSTCYSALLSSICIPSGVQVQEVK
jgi:hypothetical protein